jgi:hypothetical protein
MTTKRLRITVLLLLLPLALAARPAAAQPAARGVEFLLGRQAADGRWESPSVRPAHATAEALLALQRVAPAEPQARSAAAGFLEAEGILDSDDRSRRLLALAGEGRDVSALAAALFADRDPRGGWGLTAEFRADPLDTSLALLALDGRPGIDNEAMRRALGRLLGIQRPDGGFPCVEVGDQDAGSEIYCTTHALLALAPFRDRFLIEAEVQKAVTFLKGGLAGGRFGPAGPNEVIHTSLSSLALTAVSALGPAEVPSVIGFLHGRQQADGSWEGDLHSTALALRALQALAGVPICGDGAINLPGETCDGLALGGKTCEGLGFGPGALACTSQCTLDTSGCAELVCGDGFRNQPFEVCDGTDLAGASCQALGFASGTLACAPDCLGFDTGSCDPLPVCGDNLRNQPDEVCDGTDLAGASCRILGFESGTLACAGDCLGFDVGQCVSAPTCGDGVVNQPGELCDFNDLNGATCGSLGLGSGVLRCASDCNLDTTQCDAARVVVDNKGREFLLGFLKNHRFVANLELHLTSDVATSVTVQYPATAPSFNQTVALTPGQISIVRLPAAAHTGWVAGQVASHAVRVSGPDEFVTYMVNRQAFTSDAALALPVDALGTEYIVSTYRGSLANPEDRSEFLVVAPFDGTTVTITPTAEVRRGSGSAPAGVPFQITLDRGQGFRGEAVAALADLTGTILRADRPVAVLNGNTCTNVPTHVATCDHVFEVAHPVNTWGTSALVANLPKHTSFGTVYRVLASRDDTVVTLDGAPQTVLDRGQVLEIGPIRGDHLIAANQPIFVTQFMTGTGFTFDGDPAMANMIPPDQYLEEYTFSTVGGSQFREHFLTLVAPATSVGSLLLDGAPVDPTRFKPIGSTGFSTAIVPLAEGTHTTSSPEPHGITVEGFNNADSYLYPGGARLEIINPFCGDGIANRTAEACDIHDFRGATCASFGFSSGFLQCTAGCSVDTSQCSGLSLGDEDEDGFPAPDDCDDADPAVNPGAPEIPGNGQDDDCNPGTPDVVPPGVLTCRLTPDRARYAITDLVRLEAVIENAHDQLSVAGSAASLAVRGPGGLARHDETRELGAVPPGALLRQSFSFAVLGDAPGIYQAELTLAAGASTAAQCSAVFTLDSSAETGDGLAGTLTVEPAVVDAGDPATALYTVENRGNATLADLGLRVLLLDATGALLDEIAGTATLAPGGVLNATGSLSTIGLLPDTYLVALIAAPDGGVEKTLASAVLRVVNAPPDCSAVSATPADLWPPNHRLVDVALQGATDPDGDPVTLTVTGVFQDEPVEETGDGAFCPDATGTGTSAVKLRAERAGRGDGRVYHIGFLANDGRGGTCEGVVAVCVPRDQSRPECVDQGPLFDATTCP